MNLDDLLGLKKDKVLPVNNGDNKYLADRFVKYFDEKTERIYTSFVNVDFSCVSFMPQRVITNKLERFTEISMKDLERVMKKTKYTYCENDPFPVKDVKDALNIRSVLRVYLSIINMSITQAVFPHSEKLACIKPTYKEKGDSNDLSSYRPISNLSYLSKLIETVVNEQLCTHLKDISAIPENQSAYRENYSTETTVCAIMNDMTQIIDEGKCGILVMLDLSAAFDTVVHEYLLSDLKSIGIDGDVYEWFKSYLQNREVTVIISNSRSDKMKLTKGIPQGSVLGPTLFNIYTIELSWILKKHKVQYKIYADDTQYYFSIATIQDTINKIEELMKDIKNWMVKKKLKLNDDKTECMLFGTQHNLKKYHEFQCVNIGTTTVKIVPVIRNLGVLIDCNLTMKNHILNTVKVCNYHLRNIAFIRKYINVDTCKMLIHSHIMSRLDYCNSLYYGLPNVILKKLKNVQNKAARLIKGKKSRERITPSLIELHWLPIKARVVYKICLLTYNALRTGEPKYLHKHLMPFELNTGVTVRHANDRHRLFEPRASYCVGERAFHYSAPRLYNKLPVEIKESANITQFKKRLKTYLFEKSYDTNQKIINEQFRI